MKTRKGLIVLLGILLVAITCANNDSYAVLQSNGGTISTKDVGSWMSGIRNMEAIGGSLGLEETLNSNLTSSSTANNLDCHMQKNTEYGAMALLSASSYGNPEKVENGKTTTGNATGVVININKEWVAAGTISANSTYYNASPRYKNVHTSTYVARNGDAISETSGWHGSAASTWISSAQDGQSYFNQYKSSSAAGLLRAYSGSLFSYYGYCEKNYTWTNHDESTLKAGVMDAMYYKTWASRAVIVIGEGL